MEINTIAVAGSLESSDCQVVIRPSEGGIFIDLKSNVQAMFGKSIMKTIEETLAEMQVKDADVSVIDKGALDCVIKARVQCAVCRAAQQEYDWTKEGGQGQ